MQREQSNSEESAKPGGDAPEPLPNWTKLLEERSKSENRVNNSVATDSNLTKSDVVAMLNEQIREYIQEIEELKSIVTSKDQAIDILEKIRKLSHDYIASMFKLVQFFMENDMQQFEAEACELCVTECLLRYFEFDYDKSHKKPAPVQQPERNRQFDKKENAEVSDWLTEKEESDEEEYGDNLNSINEEENGQDSNAVSSEAQPAQQLRQFTLSQNSAAEIISQTPIDSQEFGPFSINPYYHPMPQTSHQPRIYNGANYTSTNAMGNSFENDDELYGNYFPDQDDNGPQRKRKRSLKNQTVNKKARNLTVLKHCSYRDCGYESYSVQRMKVHKKLHNGVSLYGCNILQCDYQSDMQPNLKWHKKNLHKLSGDELLTYYILDPNGDRTLAKLDDTHTTVRQKGNNNGTEPIPFIRKHSSSAAAAKKSLLAENSNIIRIYKCFAKGCTFKASSKSLLLEHQAAPHNFTSDDVSFGCPFLNCTFSAASSNMINDHYRDVHGGMCPLLLDEQELNNFNPHKVENNEDEQSPFDTNSFLGSSLLF